LGPYKDLPTTLINNIYFGPNYSISIRVLVTSFRPFIIGKRYIRMGPKTLKEGNIIIVLLRSKIPYTIRKREEGSY
jgi:hypothetical protein